MITEKDLREAIAECEGQRNPNANTCIKLAAYYTILNQITGSEMPGFSRDSGESETRIQYDGQSDFAAKINGKDQKNVLPVIDELMDAVHTLNPRLYDSVMSRL